MTIQKTSIGFEGEASRVSVQPVGNITSTNVQDALDQLAGLVAPKDAEYLVGLADGDLPNARVPTNTTTISWDFGTANQAKANIADADLLALAGLASNGIATRTATDTWTVRTITGTANEITATNGDGVSGNPTLSLPSALTFTGKTITGGTYSGATASGGFTISENLAWTGDISPAQITADQNDYNPTGLSTAAVLRLNTDASRNLTGLAGGADGRVILIHNVGSFALVLKDENASSTAGNRFALSADVTLNADQSTMLQYDSTSSRWRVIGGTGGGSGGGDLLAANNLSELSGTATTARTNLGIGTGDSPQFTAVNIGHASDTTLARVSAGVASIEGETIHTNSTSRTLTASTIELGAASDTTLSRASAGRLAVEGATLGPTVGTPVTTTSGTTVDITSIPSWVRRITITFVSVSTSGTSNPLIQIGDSGGIETSGYLGSGGYNQAANTCSAALFTTGWGIGYGIASNSIHGALTIFCHDPSANTWVMSGVIGLSSLASCGFFTGSKSLSATLDRVRITTVGGTDTFDAGSINVIYE